MDLQEQAKIYEQLIEYKPFLFLIEEMEKDVEQLKEAVVNDLVSDRLVDKGIITGIRKVITTPREIVKQARNSQPK